MNSEEFIEYGTKVHIAFEKFYNNEPLTKEEKTLIKRFIK